MAHPRSRGENGHPQYRHCKDSGSSPLTRGKQRRASAGPDLSGLIPAHAGKTDVVAQLASAMRAHPRSRGENGGLPGVSGMLHGSSPLTRGKHPGFRRRPGSRGLIPAHAGKTYQVVPKAGTRLAHPRSRGENSGARSGLIRANGSSPLTRGKRSGRLWQAVLGRLIPAHAGKTTCQRAP